MKKRKKIASKKLRNDLDSLHLNQALGNDATDEQLAHEEQTFRRSLSYGLRSTLAIIICLIIPVLWYFDWQPMDMARKTTKAVSGLFRDNPVVPLPEAPATPEAPIMLNEGIVSYMTQLKEKGLQEDFSLPAVRAFYENHVPVDWLASLKQARLLDGLSFPAIVAFHQNSVPVAYLDQYQDADLFSEFSFPAIVSFYQNNVSLDYLQKLQRAGMVRDFSFPGIVAFYQNKVPVSFLEQLKAKDLLSGLSFPDIVNMYQSS
ncbi:MAG: hypothetical protein PVH63_07110, partial [Balneolaceae bacterium]